MSALAWLAQHKDGRALSALDREKERTAASARYYLQRDDVFLEDLPALGQGAASGLGAGAGGASSSFADTRERKEDPVGVVRPCMRAQLHPPPPRTRAVASSSHNPTPNPPRTP